MNNYYKPNFTVMKKTKLFSWLLVLSIVAFSTSCKDPDPVVIIEEGLAVADGIYITQAGVDPVATSQLVAENVEDADFGTQAREGFVANFVYLASGSYTLVNVVGKAIAETYGGAATAETHDLGNCTPLNYTLVSTAVDGAAFSVATDGLYKVTYDATTSEAILINITNVGLVGSATTIGWSDGETVDLPGTIAADGATWTANDITLRKGDFKVRLNCNWVLDRRVDPGAGFAAANGYQIYTNFGGTPDNFAIGNDGTPRDISVSAVGGAAPDEANYTVTVAWTAATGFTLALTRTADAPVVSYVPADHPFGIRGTAGIDWGTTIDFAYKLNGTTHTWIGMVELSEDNGTGDGSGEFKVSDGANIWLGAAAVTDNTGGLLSGADNLVVGAGNAGFYYIVVTTADDGVTYGVTIDKGSFGLIGDAANGWGDADEITMTEAGSSFTLAGQSLLAAGGFKFRANAGWDYNLGGDVAGLTLDGANLTVAADGTYDITLSTADKGVNWTATIQ